jgi:uncharacterized protein (TIGR00369 family)
MPRPGSKGSNETSSRQEKRSDKDNKFTQLSAEQIRKRMAGSPFVETLGARLTRMHSDGITIECKVRPDLMNRWGALHGGVAATIADVAVGFALQRYLGEGQAVTTVEMKINYFAPITGGKLLARARLLRVGSKICVGSADVSDENGRAVGAALVTYMRLEQER